MVTTEGAGPYHTYHTYEYTYLEAVEVLDAVHELVEERAGLPLRQPLLADDQVEELAALGSR